MVQLLRATCSKFWESANRNGRFSNSVIVWSQTLKPLCKLSLLSKFPAISGMLPQQWQTPPSASDLDTDTGHRPPNAFILYSQAMRSAVRQENPSLSNLEISRLLGKMWKEVGPDTKLRFKQQAAVAQTEFKEQHPNYTYRKARRKKVLNDLLTKNNQTLPPGVFPTDPTMFNPYLMFGQQGAMGAATGGQLPPGAPGQGYPGFPGYPGFGMPGQAAGFQFPGK
jgi:transcription factor SOX7/8/10/18 (SOX group E/F)